MTHAVEAVAAAKAALRRRIRDHRRALAPDQRDRECAAANTALLALWDACGRPPLAAYAALPDELSLDATLAAHWRLGLPVWLPRVAAPGRLAWCAVTATTPLIVGAYGIREPAGPAAALPAAAMLVVPGVAFTRAGHRLGQGGGFYDRLLPTHPGPCLGVGFTCQLVETLPVEDHDITLRRLIIAGTLHQPGVQA
jgi:5-formyltetrahydrofolate cyclo-ligase